MALSFNTKTREPVPTGTIRKTWDAYQNSNWTGDNLGEKYDTSKLDGIPIKANLEKRDRRPNLPNHGDYWVGRYSSGKVPIGAWADIYDLSCNSGTLLNSLYYGGPKANDSSFPQRIDDDIATNCAGGSELSWNSWIPYPKTNLPIKHDQTQSETSTGCFVGEKNATHHDKEDCFVGGVHYPSFCQLGDYVTTNLRCKNQCAGIKSTDKANYCTYAKDRLCGKRVGDPLKKNPWNKVVGSTKNYITEGVCEDYCGSPGQQGSAICQKHKKDYCTDPTTWPDAAEYCSSYWKANPNDLEMTKVCGSKLLDPSSPENITTGKGCGYLCRGGSLDVHDNMCKTKRLEFCTADPLQMETEYCYQFCKDNPDLCESFLNNYCKDKGDLLGQAIPGGKRKYSDYCGCMMGTQFYEDYVKNVFDQFDEAGYNIQGASNIKTSPECIFPKCKGGSILTSAQRSNIKDCGASCIQVMLNKFIDSQVDGDFMAQQSAQCTNIQAKVEEPAATEPPVTEPPLEEPDQGLLGDDQEGPIGDPVPPIDTPIVNGGSLQVSTLQFDPTPENIGTTVGVVAFGILLLAGIIVIIKYGTKTKSRGKG